MEVSPAASVAESQRPGGLEAAPLHAITRSQTTKPEGVEVVVVEGGSYEQMEIKHLGQGAAEVVVQVEASSFVHITPEHVFASKREF